ncbi:MAG TPA: Uma2 family endonuclease [Gemmatimonadaceae bacterium]|jgi:Uma2 family endonuclease|nr:Uma2 family endonuclease [Gemmatimonadaceae bacterium]
MAMAISVPLYTVDDLEHFPDDGNRYELLDGVLLVTPQASAPHQIVANRINGELLISLQKPGFAHVVSPGAVVQVPRTQLQPDILVYPARFSPATDWRKITEHWLAVEVFSRSSRIYDREFKRDAYFALGVQQVWLVDWHERFVEVCSPNQSNVVSDTIRWRVAGVDVGIDLREVFAGLP